LAFTPLFLNFIRQSPDANGLDHAGWNACATLKLEDFMFDPTIPQEGTPLDAVQMRNQLNGLKALIDAILAVTSAQVDGVSTLPPGGMATAEVTVVGNVLHFTFGIPQGQDGAIGPAGAMGPPFSTAVVDGVTTLNPGENATVGVSFDGSNVRFVFGIPRGNDGSAGAAGSNGANGSDGTPGPQGGQGPAFANAVVDSVTTLAPGQAATVQTGFDGSNVRFSFGIPRGADGNNGSNGSDGAQGVPGEVTLAQLNSAVIGTSGNTNAVTTLDSAFADADMEALRQKLNELILNGRR
jgi:hypothetical protein